MGGLDGGGRGPGVCRGGGGLGDGGAPGVVIPYYP